jgi:hypothetical protein
MISIFQVMVRKKETGGLSFVGIPMFAIWALLLPIGLLLLPVMLVVCLVARINPFRAFVTFWRFFAALKGTHVEVEDDRRAFVLHIA